MRRAALFSLLTFSALACLQPAAAQETKAPRRPFEPVNTSGAPVVAANEAIEFVGVSQMGNTTHLVFNDKTAKKNRWVALGETVEGINVLRYDARLEQAVVKINGTEKTLALRKGTGPINTASHTVTPPPPAAGFNVAVPDIVKLQPPPPPSQPVMTADPAAQNAPAPAAPKPAPNTPEGQVKAETEARMLVSDLLEIGMAQRKAYEEQQRRAAEGKTGQPTPPAAEPPR